MKLEKQKLQSLQSSSWQFHNIRDSVGGNVAFFKAREELGLARNFSAAEAYYKGLEKKIKEAKVICSECASKITVRWLVEHAGSEDEFEAPIFRGKLAVTTTEKYTGKGKGAAYNTGSGFCTQVMGWGPSKKNPSRDVDLPKKVLWPKKK